MTTVAILQPGYLPWIGYFDLMRSADVFVAYDDVQFDKHGWRNRNRIKCAHGIEWLSVPVRHHGKDRPRINDVEIDNTKDWAQKHVRTIRQAYARAPHLEPFVTEVEAVLAQNWERLADLDLELASLLARHLGASTRVVRSSDLGVPGARSQRLVDICLSLGADRYISGVAAQDYLDVQLFVRNGIEVEWQNLEHPVYSQLHGDFASHLSALDMILNCGAESPSLLAAAQASHA